MDHFGSSGLGYGGGGGDRGADGNRRSNFNNSPDMNLKAQAPPVIQTCADVKPRLTKEQHDVLERHFLEHHKPSTATKKGFAETLGVPLDKINNWFQNRRAKVKQDAKKQQMVQSTYSAMMMPLHSQYPVSMHNQQSTEEGFPHGYYISSQDITQSGFSAAPHMPELDSDASAAQTQHYSEFTNGLHSIQESTQRVSRGGIVHNLAAAGYPVDSFSLSDSFTDGGQYLGLESSVYSPGPMNGSGFFSEPDISTPAPFGDISGLNRTMDGRQATQTSESALAQPFRNLGSVSPDTSPDPTNHSMPRSQSPSSTNMNSVASVYSGWTEDKQSPLSATPINPCEDSWGSPIGIIQEDQCNNGEPSSFWSASYGKNFQNHPSQGYYPQYSHSSQTLLSSPPTARDSMPPHISEPDANYPLAMPAADLGRKDSSTSALTESMGAVGIKGTSPTGSNFKHPSQPSSIAARRQRPRPAALGPAALNHRSASYSAGMPVSGGASQSLNPPDHTLRRIRSTGVGRIQKPTPGSAQRSPLNFTFAEGGLTAASPKFCGQPSSHGTPTSTSQGFSSINSSLAPPTPLTPREMSHFPSWQRSGIKNSINLPEHSNPDTLAVSWSISGPSPGMYTGSVSNIGSPPITPLDAAQFGHRPRLSNASIYRDTPPQSAPAIQQCFPRSVFVPQSHAVAVSQPFDEHPEMTAPVSHMRRPSLPDAAPVFQAGLYYPYAVPMVNNDTGCLGLDYPIQSTPAAPSGHQQFHTYALPQQSGRPVTSGTAQPGTMAAEFFIHEYSPPQAANQAFSPPRQQDSQRKQYIFANAGPRDFRVGAS
ncbi:hypothetical protein W97_00691 [Coniosporium apollinis CBS 100218]|uniref:Homeobox domain-containing protein n=1 Tax=Coniosporium apollinis (strain CBS 100218) TaxID=1168221 RepID=R7YIK7_CONA1|nr:uncharacterized protein W97_00691 [Coniosporium apollinis CBS 100218]EON61476.1 hypothetical protein W97_00691 [Coniosporium apollinis CBS 100218]